MISLLQQSNLKNLKPSLPGGNQGFTLAELILALGMMMLVLTVLINLAVSLDRTYTTQTIAAGVQQVTRAGLDIMVRNIRIAGFNPLKADFVGIVDASQNAFRFRYDLDGSGAIETDATPGEDITYLRNARKQLIQQKNGNSRSNKSLVDHVSALTFKYLDKDNNETSAIDAIRVVEVSLTVEEPAGRSRSVSRTYQTRVICRNLGL